MKVVVWSVYVFGELHLLTERSHSNLFLLEALHTVNIFSKYILSYFAYLSVCDVHLLQIQICSCKVNHTTVISIYKNYFSVYFIIYSL